MAERKFHRMHKMIAWNNSDFGIWAFKADDFIALLDIAMKDMHIKDQVDIRMAISENMTLSIGGQKRYFQLEKELDKIFKGMFYDQNFIDNNKHLIPAYKMRDKEAQKYLIDYLEAYRYSFKLITYSCFDIMTSPEEHISIGVMEKQSLWNKMRNRYGDLRNEINFPIKTLRLLNGTSLKFWIVFSDYVYRFDRSGVCQVDESDITYEDH